MRTITRMFVMAAAALAGAGAVAVVGAGAGDGVVPARDRAAVEGAGLTGPTETTGVASMTELGAIPLGPEFEALEGYLLRAREIEVDPGGTVAVHRHESRPGIAYILEGVVTEYRENAPGPAPKRAGEIVLEPSGTVHGWRNESDDPARVLVVDIVRPE